MRSSFVKSLLSSGAILPFLVGAGVVTTATLTMGNPAKAEMRNAPSLAFEQVAEATATPEIFMRGGHEYNVVKSTYDGEAAIQSFIKLGKGQYRFYPDPTDNPGTFYAPKNWPFKNGETVKEVRLDGAEVLDADFAKQYIHGEDHAKRVRNGEPFDYDVFVLAVTSLFATGLYWEIVVSREDDTLIINAIESPVVRGEVVGREDLMSAEEKAALEAKNRLDKKEANALYAAVRFKMIEGWEVSKNKIVSEYSEWKRYNIAPFQAGKFTGDQYINLYANEKVDGWSNFDQMPIGTVLVIDSFHGDADRIGYAARWKAGDLVILEKMKKGFNAASGNWKITKIDKKGQPTDITKEKDARSTYFFPVPNEYKRTVFF